MIPIDTEKRINWHKIRAEYIGGASQRSLAEKYGVSHSAVEKHCRNERWTEQRKAAMGKVTEKVIQKTADLAADNATIAAGIKRKALILLDKLIDDYMQLSVTEHQEMGAGTKDIKRLRDITAAYKDLTGDMPKGETGQDVEDLSPLVELLK